MLYELSEDEQLCYDMGFQAGMQHFAYCLKKEHPYMEHEINNTYNDILETKIVKEKQL